MRHVFPVIFALVLGFAVPAGTVAAEEGAAVYGSLKCGLCHRPDRKSAAVSLVEIAKAYQSRDTLVKFFKGEIEPLIESDNWGMMRSQMPKIAALPEEQQEELAGYIMSFH